MRERDDNNDGGGWGGGVEGEEGGGGGGRRRRGGYKPGLAERKEPFSMKKKNSSLKWRD